ncbi:hypothetical protein ACH5RR_041429, partial [Cinchona calisaya]
NIPVGIGRGFHCEFIRYDFVLGASVIIILHLDVLPTFSCCFLLKMVGTFNDPSNTVNMLGLAARRKAMRLQATRFGSSRTSSACPTLIGSHTWSPDAMEGPTPVSALIHAATMVTTGVFMIARCSPLFEYPPTALIVITFAGAMTSFLVATTGILQNDLKRIIAYSTCSQLVR